MTRHKVFISYHHENDEEYKGYFEKYFENIFINKSVKDGEYDEDLSDEYIKRLIREDKISDSSVVVVLIGAETYKRKHVDWEIYAGLSGKADGHSGLLGILLPTYYNSPENISLEQNEYNPETIPPRLNDNVETKYSEIYKWEDMRKKDKNGELYIKKWIDDAYNRISTDSDKINNSRLQFKINRS